MEKADLGGVWPYLDPWDSVFTHSIRGVECAREVWTAWQKLQATMPGSETFSPFITADIRTPFFSADVLQKCALIALHLVAEEGRGGEDGCHAPDLRDERKCGCPKSPMWESEGGAGHEDKSVSSSDSRGDNVCNDALHVIGLDGPGYAVPGNA